MGITVLSVEMSVVEVREKYLKMVRRGFLLESEAVKIIRTFAEEKKKVIEGQTYITIFR